MHAAFLLTHHLNAFVKRDLQETGTPVRMLTNAYLVMTLVMRMPNARTQLGHIDVLANMATAETAIRAKRVVSMK